MPLIPGSLAHDTASVSEYTNSMAKAMELAFQQEWHNAMGADKAIPDANNQMRLMFVAVAQGIVKHLLQNPDAFKFNDLTGTSSSTSHLTSIAFIQNNVLHE